MPSNRIRVLVIDDSAMVRKVVSDALRTDPGIEVVGTAGDPYAARDRILELKPDVLTLDLEMPRMDGLTFLKIVMEQHPMPVIVISTLTHHGTTHALEALRLGAFDVIGKPSNLYAFGQMGPQLVERVKASVGAKLRPPSGPPSPVGNRSPFPFAITARQVMVFGASTGGTEALRDFLTQLPRGLPGIAIVQHLPPVFSKAFADRLSTQCAFEVREAADGDRLQSSLALIAPGNLHMMLVWAGDHYRVRITDGPPVWHQRPAVDLLFKSAVDCGAAPHTLAGLFTGMGRDGADGLLKLREKGATTFAQDEATSVVYGMPKAAWEIGAAQRQLPLGQVAGYILEHHETAARGAPTVSLNLQ